MPRHHKRLPSTAHTLTMHTDIWWEPEWRRLTISEQITYLMLCCQPRTGIAPTLTLSVDEWAELVSMSEFDLMRVLIELVNRDMVAIEGEVLTLLWLDYFGLPSLPSRIQRERRKVTPRLREAVFARDGRFCRACGVTENLHIDHVVPIARGGLTEMENLAVLCGPCNGSKGSKPWHEWLEARR